MKEVKICARCGRDMAWRKKWAKTWAEVKYCSEACKRGVSKGDRELESKILELLNQRERTASICPSEVARAVRGEDGPWRELMEPVRQAARRLAAKEMVEVTQKGKVVDAAAARGPVRIRRRDS